MISINYFKFNFLLGLIQSFFAIRINKTQYFFDVGFVFFHFELMVIFLLKKE